METSYLKTLELDKIIARAAEGCVCKEARAMLLAIEPQCDPDEVRYALEQTDVFEGLIGTLVMDPATHNPSMACAVYECHGDSFDFKEIIEAQ